MKYMKNHFAGILSVILAVVSLSGSSMPVVSANSAERIAKKETIVKLDEKLGAEPGKVLEELKNHEKDGYYLGTPYSGYPLTAENCMRPNGAYGGNGAMNCTGFVAYVLEKCGADLSEIDKGSLRGGKVNASNWFHWMTDNAVESYHYNTIEELLMSAEYIMAGGNENIILCERGVRTFETYTRNTLDLSAVPVLHNLTHLPVIIDPSHATGHAHLVKPMALAATACGADGIMIEVHNNPAKALCDGPQSLTPAQFADVMDSVRKIKEVL